MTQQTKDKTPVQRLLLPSYILYTGKFLNTISPSLASKFAAKLFLTPFRYELPEREKKMDRESVQENMVLPKSQKEIVVYRIGNSNKKILLVHGWSGRGTQLAVLAEEFLKKGYSIYSFDAPAHGKAPGKTSMMPYFIEGIEELDKKYGPFDAAVAHSLGGMATLKAVKEGVPLNKLVIIGTANSITHITREFIRNMQMDERVAKKMKKYFDNRFGQDMDNYSGAVSAEGVKIPTLVVHDEEDVDVQVSSAYEIANSLEQDELFITSGLGHRRILGDRKVLDKILSFLSV